MPRPPFARSSVLLALGASAALGACRDWGKYDPGMSSGGGSSSSSTGLGGSASNTSSSSTTGGGVVCSLPLVDTFDAPPLGSLWAQKNDNAGALGVANHELVLTLPTMMAYSNAEITAIVPHDLTGCRGFVRLTQAPSMNTKAVALLQLLYDGYNAVILLETGGSLQAKKQLAGKETIEMAVPYDPVSHAYLGISELDGKVRWETSPDGTTWTTLIEETSWLPSPQVYFKLGASTYQMEPSAPGETHFDNVDVVP